MLDIVIVNWNAGPLLAECVRSIGEARQDGFSLGKIVIVDNASTDGSLESALAASPGNGPVEAVRNDVNRGFGRACNQGAANSKADFLLFLNPDTRLFAESLSRPMAYLADPANASVGVCGIQLLNEDGSVSRTCARAPTPGSMAAAALGLDRARPRLGYMMRDWDHAEGRDVDHVIGAFYLVRRSAFAAAGGFDESFFVYLEDLDLSLRLKRSGWRCHYLASASAYHKGGGTSEKVRAHRLAYSLESRLRYASKHLSQGPAIGIALLTLTAEPFLRLALAASELSLARAAETIGGYALLAASLGRSVLRKAFRD